MSGRQRAGGSNVGRRLGGRVFTAAFLSALVICVANVSGAAGQLPQLPGVQVPSLPAPPKLVPPVQVPKAPVQVPDVPQVRLPSTPRVEVPRVRVPSSPSAPSAPARGVTPAAGGTGSTQGATPSAPTSSGSPARPSRGRAQSAGPRARGHHRTPSSSRSRTGRRASAHTLRERRFRQAVVRLWTCSYAVSPVQRRVLVLRTGLGGSPAQSVKDVAKALSLSSGRVVRAQRAGLRGLRRANRSDGCATGFSSQPAIARDTQAVLAVATASPLASVTQMADAASGQGAPARAHADSGAVLAERVASAGSGDNGRVPIRTAAAVPTSADAGSPPWPVLLIILLLAISAAGFVLLRKRGMGPQRDTTEAAAAAFVVAEPVRATPAPEVTEPTPPPGPSYPPNASTAQPAPNKSVASRGVRRAAGVAASGAASVLLGLALRARRRR